MPSVVGVDRVKLDASNAVYRVLAKCVDVCDKLGVPWCIENPTNSLVMGAPLLRKSLGVGSLCALSGLCIWELA